MPILDGCNVVGVDQRKKVAKRSIWKLLNWLQGNKEFLANAFMDLSDGAPFAKTMHE